MRRIKGNWLDYFLKYCDGLYEADDDYLLWTGVFIISGALQRNVCVIRQKWITYPNWFLFLEGPSASRKSEAVGIAKEMLESLDKKPAILAEEFSPQALVRRLEKRCKWHMDGEHRVVERDGFAVGMFDELASALPDNRSKSMMATAIGRLYDCPKKWDSSFIGRGDTIFYKTGLTLLAAVTPAALRHILPPDSTVDGLASRCIVIHREDAHKCVYEAKMPPEKKEQEQQLISDLNSINKLSGEYKLDKGAEAVWRKWYRTFREESPKYVKERYVGFHGRKQSYVMKLAIIQAAGEGDGLVLKSSHLEAAIDRIDKYEPEILRALGLLDQTAAGRELQRVVATLRRAGKAGMRGYILTERMGGYFPVKRLREHLDTLEASGRLRTKNMGSGTKLAPHYWLEE